MNPMQSPNTGVGRKLCAGNEPPAPPLLAVGDRVEWDHPHPVRKGKIEFRLRVGKIEEIGGFSATVKMRNGRRFWLLLSSLRQHDPTN